MTGAEILRMVVPPLVFVYAVFLAMLAAWWRGRDRRLEPTGGEAIRAAKPAREEHAPGVADVLRHLIITAGGGFVLFMAIVLFFMFLLVGDRRAPIDALTRGGLLAFGIAVPTLFLLGLAERRLGSRIGARRRLRLHR